MQTSELEMNGTKYILRVLVHRRRNSTVNIRDNVITIRLSSFASKKEREDHLSEFLDWAKKKIMAEPERFRPPKMREYRNNDVIEICNEKYALRIDYAKRKSASAKAIGNIIRIILPEDASGHEKKRMTSNLLAKVISKKRLPVLHNRIKLLNNMFFQKEIKEIRFRNMSSRWGSCTKDGKISISSRLLLAPDSILDYVCVHELAHLVHFNHSKEFWELVGRVIPDYKERDMWLSENGEKCVF
ncbi:MAG: M48 family metallopeptidase [Candidatus Micrarchaeota archaeon]|nr:M48 family metallopeptidase [Candidatus Micrarchaeota archaeon]